MYVFYSKNYGYIYTKIGNMCLAVPGKINSVYFVEGDLRMAKVSFSGVIKEICIEWLQDVTLGDYILAHAGTAISKVNEEDAKETMQLYKQWMESLDKEDTQP